jgi:hypothetical protein
MHEFWENPRAGATVAGTIPRPPEQPDATASAGLPQSLPEKREPEGMLDYSSREWVSQSTLANNANASVGAMIHAE